MKGTRVTDGTRTWLLDDTTGDVIADDIHALQWIVNTNRIDRMRQLIATAQTNNDAFLALSPPTVVQAVAHVNALTRQMQGVLALLDNILGQQVAT